MKLTRTSTTPFKSIGIVLDAATVDSLLSINVRNRNLLEGRAQAYAGMMADGTWCDRNPTGMTFTVNESMTWLMDGQTRLEAFRRAGRFGMAARLDFVPDAAAEAVFRSMDAGSARTSGQTAKALGLANANKKAAIVRTLLAMSSSQYPTTAAVTRLCLEADALLAAMPITRQHVVTGTRPPSALFAGALNAARVHGIGIDAASDYIRAAMDDEGAPDSAAKMTSRFLSKEAAKRQGNKSGGAAPERMLFALATAFARRHAEGIRYGVFRVSDAEVAAACAPEPDAAEFLRREAGSALSPAKGEAPGNRGLAPAGGRERPATSTPAGKGARRG